MAALPYRVTAILRFHSIFLRKFGFDGAGGVHGVWGWGEGKLCMWCTIY